MGCINDGQPANFLLDAIFSWVRSYEWPESVTAGGIDVPASRLGYKRQTTTERQWRVRQTDEKETQPNAGRKHGREGARKARKRAEQKINMMVCMVQLHLAG